MTKRSFGRTAKMARLSTAALAAVLIAAATGRPALAQQDETPAPTPAPSATSPSTFRLPSTNDGRTTGMQGPADNGIPPLAPGERRGTPAPTPAPAPTVVVPTRPATAPTTQRPTATTPAPTPAPTPTRRDTPAAASTRPPSATPAPAPTPAPTASQGAPAATPPADDAATLPGFTSDPTSAAGTLDAPVQPSDEAAGPAAPIDKGAVPIWAWLLAGLAAAGAGLWYWRRRPAPAADAPADYDQPSPPPAPRAAVPAPRAAAPQPAPRPAPPAPQPAPQPDREPQPQFRPTPLPIASPPVPSPLVTRPAAERRAQVSMAFEVRDIRLTSEHLVVSFTLNLLNEGLLDATGLLVRIALHQASAMPEAVLARFFDGAGGSVLRDDMTLAAGAGEALTTEVMLPRAIVEPLVIAGRPMLIPVIALDVTYHWDGPGEAFGQNAGSFVLGREQGTSGSDKLAPLPFDRPMLVIDRPGARTTAVRRMQ
ncbi:hypothetical protein [Sphingopyxis sp.]|uniref:hypothetical protein n=1 Tax=Sphingopyxis sp. TaxID=1908224 RepID=UPI0025872B2D|nr:hypothetical protein [Sphingopyxis sp.]